MIELIVTFTVAAAVAITVATILEIRGNREVAKMEKIERRELRKIARA